KVAEQAQEKTSRFMKSLTHEIERPIPAIGYLLENLKLMFNRETWNIDKKKFVRKIRDCQASLDLLNVIASTITQQTEVITPTYQKENLEVVILNRLYAMLINFARSNKRGFHFQLISDMKWFVLDANLTKQVLVILLLNAFKYSHRNSTVYLYVRHSRGGIEFEVENEGETIPLDDIDKIFEWEYRSPAIRQQNYPGAGIGLALAKQIAGAMDAGLYVKSREPKTIFAFELKLRGSL
ncbi:sensor histidine kinase, partial [Candidatus Pacearchaeota archaeon]|nr:sensor histidine kinase [Candidatus Pacearchaeota archaeon]